jgi:hypothetical protein
VTTAHGLRRAAAGGAGGLTSITFVNSAISNAATITVPAAAQTGDVAILFDVAESTTGTPPSDVVPTNWTGITTTTFVNSAGNGQRCRISYKILTGGDPGASITGMNGTARNDKVMLVVRGNVAATAVSAEDWTLVGEETDPASQTVNASTLGTAPLVVFGMANARLSTAVFSTASPAFDATVADGTADLLAGYKIYDSAPADHTIDMADLGNNMLASGFLELT